MSTDTPRYDEAIKSGHWTPEKCAKAFERELAQAQVECERLDELNSQLLGGYAGGTRLDMLADWHDHRLKQEGRAADLKDPMRPGALIRGTMGYVTKLEQRIAALTARLAQAEGLLREMNKWTPRTTTMAQPELSEYLEFRRKYRAFLDKQPA